MYNLGVIGISVGNGHPYSWSAIFNGYDSTEMNKCPFESIPKYLDNQIFPDDFLSNLAQVNYIWTQDKSQSIQIARSSKIRFVLENMIDMLDKVDAVLFARDDAEYRLEMIEPFLQSGKPIYIDKPFALTLKDAYQMLDMQTVDYQIFTCSSLRFSKELLLNENEKKDLGGIYKVTGIIMNSWQKYAIHLLEPIIVNSPDRGDLISVLSENIGPFKLVTISWSHLFCQVIITGDATSPIELNYYGEGASINKVFNDSFSCFKESLFQFINQIELKKNLISRNDTLELVKIIEMGNI